MSKVKVILEVAIIIFFQNMVWSTCSKHKARTWPNGNMSDFGSTLKTTLKVCSFSRAHYNMNLPLFSLACDPKHTLSQLVMSA